MTEKIISLCSGAPGGGLGSLQQNQKGFGAPGLTSHLTQKETEARRDYKVLFRVRQV